MRLNRTFAALVLAAGLGGGALAQDRAVRDDETIFLAVEQALDGALPLAWARISVRSQEGYVTLSGVADNLQDIALAGQLAAKVRGVTGVANEIKVADRASRA